MARRGRRLAAVLLVTAACSAPLPALAAPQAPAGPTARAGSTSHLPAWWFAKMKLAEAQRVSTGKGATVAVIDSSLDTSIPELRGADVTFGHTCPAGYEKKATSTTGWVADHGTAMTTLIVGSGRGNGPGGRGILGVAPDARVLFYPNDRDGKYSKHIDCDELEMGRQIVDAARRGADIINLSFDSSPTIEPYVRKAMALGSVVVAAAGDRRDQLHGWIRQPAAIPGVVAVDGVDDQARPWRNNPLPLVVGGTLYRWPATVSAPGVDVPSVAYDSGGWRSGFARTGTSDATAIVSGVLALVKARYPRATGNQLIQQLIHHTGGTHPFQWSVDYGYGIVSANRMLATDPTGWPDENPLLELPRVAKKRYPPSSYDRFRALAHRSSDQGADPSVTAGPSATPGSSVATGSPSPSVAAAAGVDGRTGGDGGSGGPAWTWFAGLGVLLVAAVAVVVRVASRRAAAPEHART